MSGRIEREVGVIPHDTGPHPTPRKGIGMRGRGMSIPIISETTIPSQAAITTTTTPSIALGPKSREEAMSYSQSRQFLSPDVGFGHHPHSHLHSQLVQGGGGLGGNAGPGGTNLERVPSSNRLQPQSSTETSGLGETVTSGFSSQESVHSASNYALGASTPTAPDGLSPHPSDHDPRHFPAGSEPNLHHYQSYGMGSPASSRTRYRTEGRSLSPQEAHRGYGQLSAPSVQQKQSSRSDSSNRHRGRWEGPGGGWEQAGYGASRSDLGAEFSGSERTLVEEGDSTRGSGGRERESEGRGRRDSAGRRGSAVTETDTATDRRAGSETAVTAATTSTTSATHRANNGRPRATTAGDIDRAAQPRARPRHGTAAGGATAAHAAERSGRGSESAGIHTAPSPVQQAGLAAERERTVQRGDNGPRNGDKVGSPRREKEKTSSRSSPKDKNGRDKEKSVYRTSSRDSVARSPEKSLNRDGSREGGTNGRHRRDSSSSKRDGSVGREFTSQQDIYSLADGESVGDGQFVFGGKSSVAGRESKHANDKDDNGKERTIGTNPDTRRKEKQLERQKSKDSGIDRTLDRSQSREGVRERPLEKQLSRDSGTGRSLEGQSPREPTIFDPSTRSVGLREESGGHGGREELRRHSRTVDEVDTATFGGERSAGRDHGRERALFKHSSADTASSNKTSRKLSRERTLDRQSSVDEVRRQDSDDRGGNPHHRSAARAGGNPGSAVRSNPHRSASREKLYDNPGPGDSAHRADRADSRDVAGYRPTPRDRTLDKKFSGEDPKQYGYSEGRGNPHRGEPSVDKGRSGVVGRDYHARGNPRDRSADRQTSAERARRPSDEDKRRNPFQDHLQERSQDRRKGTDDIQLRELSNEERRTQRKIPRGEVSLDRQSSVEEDASRRGDNVKSRIAGGSNGRDQAYDRQTAGAEGPRRSSASESHPQRRFSRERTLDRQLSLDESRQIIENVNDHGRSSQRPQPTERPVEPTSRQTARIHRGEGRSETLAQIHGQNPQGRVPDRSLDRQVIREAGSDRTRRGKPEAPEAPRADNKGGSSVGRDRRDSGGQPVDRRRAERGGEQTQRLPDRSTGTSKSRNGANIGAVSTDRPHHIPGTDGQRGPRQREPRARQEAGFTADSHHKDPRAQATSTERQRADRREGSTDRHKSDRREDSKDRQRGERREASTDRQREDRREGSIDRQRADRQTAVDSKAPKFRDRKEDRQPDRQEDKQTDRVVAERAIRIRSDRPTIPPPKADASRTRGRTLPNIPGEPEKSQGRPTNELARPSDRPDRQGTGRQDVGRPAHVGVERVKAEERASVHRSRDSDPDNNTDLPSSTRSGRNSDKETTPSRREGQQGTDRQRGGGGSAVERARTEDRRQEGERRRGEEGGHGQDTGRGSADHRQGDQTADRVTRTQRTGDLQAQRSRVDGREGAGAERTPATTATSTTASRRTDPVTMGSDGRQPRGQRQHPPRTIVTVTSPTSPENYQQNMFRPSTNGGVSGQDSRPIPQPRHPDSGREVNFDNLFSQARNAKGPGPGGGPGGMGTVPGLHVEQINHEWERRESRGSLRSNRSRSSHGGSFRSGRSGSTRRRGLFLGLNTESAWTRWSRDRRASFRRRIELLDKPEENIARVSTPVRKARQEGLKFVHPDLEGTFLSEEDLNELRRHKQQKYHAIRVIEKNRKSKFRMKTEVHLTAEQWQVISDFWDHPAFVRGRYLGLFLMFVSFIIMVVSITHSKWVTYEAWNLTIYEGLWMNCSTPVLTAGGEEICVSTEGRGYNGGIWHSCYQNRSDPEAAARCPEKRPHWQNAVIGLMIFAASFGVLASVLSICGVCTTPLPRKIYYFHSAGEIFLICALSTGVALMVFPIAIEIDNNISSHRYGIGYGLGWGGAFFFLAAAVCMSLDDLVREASRAKCCKWCWRSKQNDRTELRQV